MEGLVYRPARTQSGRFWHHVEMTPGESELGETGPSLSPQGPAAPALGVGGSLPSPRHPVWPGIRLGFDE